MDTEWPPGRPDAGLSLVTGHSPKAVGDSLDGLGLSSRHDVGIRRQGRDRVRVAQHGGDRANVRSPLEQPGRAGVPEVVQPGFDLGGLCRTPEAVADTAWVPWLAERIGEDAIIVLVAGAGTKPFFVLPGTMRAQGLDRQPIQGNDSFH